MFMNKVETTNNVLFCESSCMGCKLEHRLEVCVDPKTDIPKKVFVYHVTSSSQEKAEFDHIATLSDLQELPEDSATETVPWFLAEKCTLLLRSDQDVKLAKQLFIDDISELSRNLTELGYNN